MTNKEKQELINNVTDTLNKIENGTFRKEDFGDKLQRLAALIIPVDIKLSINDAKHLKNLMSNPLPEDNEQERNFKYRIFDAINTREDW